MEHSEIKPVYSPKPDGGIRKFVTNEKRQVLQPAANVLWNLVSRAGLEPATR